MHIITELFHVERCQTKLKSDFSTNKQHWEKVDNEFEEAKIDKGYYWMKNKSSQQWHYFKTKSPVYHFDNFVFDTSIELLSKNEQGHFGLVWGFDEDRKFLNRFTLSADGKRALFMHFEKDHHKIFHRFQNRKLPKFDLNKPIHFSIIKLGEYFHFLINAQKVYVAHESVFCANGFFVGYYIEPQLAIKSNFFGVKKIKAKALEVENGLELLLDKRS
jgi:hypothetical protein